MAQLNTIANILSTCVKSPGGLANDGSLCGSMFSLTFVASAMQPVLVWVKLLFTTPVKLAYALRIPASVLVSVTDMGIEIVLTARAGKVRLVAESWTDGTPTAPST